MTMAEPRNDIQDLVRKTSILEIVGDMIRVRTTEAALGNLALVENTDGATSIARVVGLDRVYGHLASRGDCRAVD